MDITKLGTLRIDETTYKKLLKQIKLKVSEEYINPPVIIQMNDITIATLGNFSASVGKPKSKKTYNVSAIVAAALSGRTILNYTVTLPKGKNKILYIDTEQSKYHCHKVLERIIKMAGLSTNQECDDIDFFVLREYTPEQRCDIIRCALKDGKGYGLVIIDGIRDLVRDINSPSESLEIINDLMRWSSHFDLHIHTVLHLNKGDDNTRGHLGTELNNKAETVLQITKNLEDGSMSEIRAMLIRDKEFEPFAFRIDNDGLPCLVENYQSGIKKDRKMHFSKLSEDQNREAIESVIGDNQPVGYGQMLNLLQSGYSNIGYSRGRNTIIGLLKYLINMGLIMKVDKCYKYIPKTEETPRKEKFSLV